MSLHACLQLSTQRQCASSVRDCIHVNSIFQIAGLQSLRAVETKCVGLGGTLVKPIKFHLMQQQQPQSDSSSGAAGPVFQYQPIKGGSRPTVPQHMRCPIGRPCSVVDLARDLFASKQGGQVWRDVGHLTSTNVCVPAA